MGMREVIMKCSSRYIRNSTSSKPERCGVTDASLYSEHIEFELLTVKKLLLYFPSLLTSSLFLAETNCPSLS
jgi:hypothetical protein